MNLNPNDFMHWFSDHLDRSNAQSVSSDIISCAVQSPGKIVKFSVPNGGDDYLNFSVRIIIKDYSALRRMQKSLCSSTMKIHNALLINGQTLEKGAVLIVKGETVGLIAVRDVIEIEVGAEKATETVDTKKFRH